MVKYLCYFFHGLGDAVQFTTVLRHIQKHMPRYVIDMVTDPGKESCWHGLCNASYHTGQTRPSEDSYDHVRQFSWDENYDDYIGEPTNKVTKFLREVFHIKYDASLAQYQMNVDVGLFRKRITRYFHSIGAIETDGRFNVVLIHPHGNSVPVRKNMTPDQARALAEKVIANGRIPIILDWEKKSKLPDQKQIFCPRTDTCDLWPRGVGEADMIYAMIQMSELFVGIDSGPGKVASATDTNSLIYWSHHSPIQFHDPAPNTLHFIPLKRTYPTENGKIFDYMIKHYRCEEYQDMVRSLSEHIDMLLQSKKIRKDHMAGNTNLRSTKFDEHYYDEHKDEGMDYLHYGDWQKIYCRWFVEAFNLRRKSVLDLGCACGAIAQGFQDQGCFTIGIDVNEHTIALGKRHFSVKLAVCDACNLHMLDDASIDFIHCQQVGEHWKTKLIPVIFEEIVRVLTPGGFFFFCVDTLEMLARQGRDQEKEDPTNQTIQSLAWWIEQANNSGLLNASGKSELEKFTQHPDNYLCKYDWDWVLFYKPE